MPKIKIIAVNPKRTAARKRTSPATAKKRRKKNPGALTLMGPINPHKGTKMKTKKKANTAHRKPRRRHNPVVHVGKHRRRHNPNVVGRSFDLLKTGGLALGGLVLTRQLPQIALGTKNTGVMGYAANVLTMLAAAALATKLLGKQAGGAVGIGGGLYVANRLITENISPVGKALSLQGVGDATAASPAQLAGIRPAYFPVPVVYDRQGNPQVPSLITDTVRQQLQPVAAPPTSKLAGLRMRA